MSIENEVEVKDKGGIYTMTPAIFAALERQVLTRDVMATIRKIIYQVARDTVSGATRGDKIPGPMTRDDTFAILARLLPGKFPHSEGKPFSLNDPTAKFPPLFAPNKKDENGQIIRNAEGFAVKDYSHCIAEKILNQAYNFYCCLVANFTNPDSKSYVYCQIDQEDPKNKAILENMKKGDMGALKTCMFSPMPEYLARLVAQTGIGPTDFFTTIRKEDDKPDENALLMNSWTKSAHERTEFNLISAYGTKCATPREDCSDGLAFSTKKLMIFLHELGVNPKAPAYLGTQGTVSKEKYAIAIAYASYKKAYSRFHGGENENMTQPDAAIQAAIEAVPETAIKEFEQKILSQSDAAPDFDNAAPDFSAFDNVTPDFEKMLNSIHEKTVGEEAREMKDESLVTAIMPDGPEEKSSESAAPRRGRGRPTKMKA